MFDLIVLIEIGELNADPSQLLFTLQLGNSFGGADPISTSMILRYLLHQD